MDVGEKIIIGMIGVEILLGLLTILITVHEGNLQGVQLTNILAAQKQVDSDLGTVNSNLGILNDKIATTVSALDSMNGKMAQTATAAGASATTSQKMAKALTSQVELLSEQQAGGWPALGSDFGGAPCSVCERGAFIFRELKR